MSTLLPAALSLLAAAALGLHILLRARKTPYHWLLFAVLLGISVWSGGCLLRRTVTTVDALRASLQLIYLGVLVTPAAWLLLAGFLARARFVRSPAALAALCTPPALMYLCLVTNEGHRLFFREVSFRSLSEGPAAFAGPVFWMAAAWAYACVAGSIWLHMRGVPGVPRSRAWLMVVAALAPALSNFLWLAQLLPLRVDLTPSAFVVTLVILHIATFRYQLLASLPLAHRAVVDHLEDGVVMASPLGRIVDCNPAAERLVGQRAANLRGRQLDEVLSEIRRPVGASEDAAEGRWLEVTEGEVSHGDGHAVGRFALLLDRGEERRSEQLVQRAQRLETVGALAAGIAHEINDPLAFARSNLAQVVAMGERVDAVGEGPDAELALELADLHAIAVETLDGVERMAKIAADMRRLTAEPHRTWDAIDLREVVSDAVRLSRVDEAGLRLETCFDETGVFVTGSAERLVQIVVNLLANARQAVSDAGRVRVSVCSRADTAQVVVEDDGPGIPEALRERIFDPFFTTKSPDAGTGLGLAIAYDIARDHGGVLEESGAAGGGARFMLRLPLLAR